MCINFNLYRLNIVIFFVYLKFLYVLKCMFMLMFFAFFFSVVVALFSVIRIVFLFMFLCFVIVFVCMSMCFIICDIVLCSDVGVEVCVVLFVLFLLLV